MESKELPETTDPQASFQQEWHLNSPARIFSIPCPTTQRAWERQPRLRRQLLDATAASNTKPRTIWKRQPTTMLSSQPNTSSNPVAAASKAVKKVKLTFAPRSACEAVCKRDRRSGSLPHKSLDHFINPSSEPQSDQLHPVDGNDSNVPATSHVSLSLVSAAQQQSDLLRTTDISSGEVQPPDAHPRFIRSSTSLLKRRKTDLVFSRAKLAFSPSRKRRLSDASSLLNKSLVFETSQDVPVQQTTSVSAHRPDPSLKLESESETLTSSEPVPVPVQQGHQTEVGKENFKLVSEEILARQDPHIPASSEPAVGFLANNPNDHAASAGSVLEQLEPSPTSDAGMLNIISHHSHQESDSVKLGTVDVSNLERTTLDGHQNPYKSEQTAADDFFTPTQTTSPPAARPSEQSRSTVKILLNDDDTDILHDFLNRAKASKAAKIAEQSSILNRHDSDRVKDALALPRKPLEVLDANSPSPKKTENSVIVHESDFEPLLKSEDQESPSALDKPAESVGLVDNTIPEQLNRPVERQLPTRRSKRNISEAPSIPPRSSSASGIPPNIISVRLQDQRDTVLLKKSEAKELETLTKTNTRLNRGASSAQETVLRLNKIEAISDMDGASPSGVTKVRWNDNLVSFFLESRDAPSKLPSQSEENEKTIEMEKSRPRARRAKMLGAVNGTPAKQRTRRLESTHCSPEDDLVQGKILQDLATGIYGKDSNRATQLSEQIHFDEPSSLKAGSEDKEPEPQHSPQTSSGRAPRRIPTPAKSRNRDIQLQNNAVSSIGRCLGPSQASPRVAAVRENKENREPGLAHPKDKSTPLHLPIAQTAAAAEVKLNAMDETRRRTVAPRKASLAVANAQANPGLILARRK